MFLIKYFYDYISHLFYIYSSNSRIADIIRQYNQANEIIKNHEMDEGSHCDALIAPPPMDFPAGKDEDWELQKSLEAKHREEVRFSNLIVILKIAM